jgi:GTPase SAR1 family protein
MSTKQIFIQQTDNFINELCTIFSNNGEILLFGEKYNLIRNANSKLIIEYFIQFVYPHKAQIMQQDENFFLNGGGQEEIKDTSGLKFRDNLTKLWIAEMSDENKEIIWKYFKIFVLLCEKYILENIGNEK